MSASLIETLATLDHAEIIKVTKACIALLEKKGKAPKEKAAPKEKKGSMPKGVIPPQLMKPRAWVDATLEHANANGWESFSMKEKDTLMEVPASVEREGVHVFELTGKGLTRKHAMSLSKVRWTPKTSTGTHETLYREFEASYVPPTAEMVEEAKLKEKAEVAEEKDAKVLAKVSEPKAEPKEEPKAKAAKEEPKAKAAKEEPKAKAAKEEPKAKATQPKSEPKPKAKTLKEVDTFQIEDDGSVMQWDFKGKSYLRNFAGQLWQCTDGELGKWCGVLNKETMKIDDSAAEPIFEDE
jgi:hypothetical protein